MTSVPPLSHQEQPCDWHLQVAYSVFANNDDFQLRSVILFLLTGTVPASTHNLCFRAKLEEKIYPSKPQFHYIKAGYKGV